MKLKSLFFVLVMSIMNAACGSSYNWKEEVLLHDGSTIVVKRSVNLGRPEGEIGQGPGVSNQTLDFKAPDGRDIHWEEPGRLRLMVLDFENGIPYLASKPALGFDQAYYGCPNPGYVFFKYVDQWQRIEFKDFPSDSREANLIIDTKGHADKFRSQKFFPTEIKEMNEGLALFYQKVDPNHPSPKGCNINLNYWREHSERTFGVRVAMQFSFNPAWL